MWEWQGCSEIWGRGLLKQVWFNGLTLKHEKTGNNLHSSDYPFIWKWGVYENHWLFWSNNNWQTLFRLELLRSVRHWLDALEVREPGLLDYCASSSQLSVHLSVTLNCLVASLSYATVVQNPLYEQLAGLRFRSMCYLEGIWTWRAI